MLAPSNLTEDDPIAFGVHGHRVTLGELALQQLERERILDEPLDGPLEGPGAEGRVVSLPGQQGFGGVGDL